MCRCVVRWENHKATAYFESPYEALISLSDLIEDENLESTEFDFSISPELVWEVVPVESY